MRSFKIIIIICIAITAMPTDCFPQFVQTDTAHKTSVSYHTMPAGSRFAASRTKQFWWGRHWRKEWLQPVSFPILNLDSIAGGLTPLKRGGGHETKTLRFLGHDGKEYVLRTIDKSLDVLIPEQFKGSFINDIVNDQISTAHPYGPLVIASLAGSIGILHTNPAMGFVPDNPVLGEFKNDFANKLCLFEERPSGDGWSNTALTNFADDIINSEKLFKKLQENNNGKVDQKEFLKVRLFDMLINDWDRHEDQWVWAVHKKDGKIIYQPFARDRDQAFSKTDGVNLYFLSRPWALRSIQNMDANVKDVIGTNLSAVSLDKKFTNELTEADWKQIIIELQQLLTDTTIQKALLQMPSSIYAISGKFLYNRLQQRRNNMLQFGMQYYKIINKEVTVATTDKQEVFIINKIDATKTEITIRAINKETIQEEVIYYKIFNHAVTKQITLYGLGGNDRFFYTGKSRNKILIRVLGGDGYDLFLDSTVFKNRGKKSKIYDSPADIPTTSNSFYYKATIDTSLTNYHRKQFKYDWWMPLITPGYNPDDGFIIGAGITYKKQQWHKKPYGWQQIFRGNYAASTGAFSLFYNGIFKQVIGKWDLDIAASYKAPSFIINFYGFGNDSKLQADNKSFYRVRAKAVHLNPGLSRSWNSNLLRAGLLFNSVKVEKAESKFIGQIIPSIDSSVFSNKYFAGANFSYTLNTSDNYKNPSRGINYTLETSYQLNLKNSKRDLLNVESACTFYYSPFKNFTIAHRTGTAINFGDYEFYQANTIGGNENLRGYWRTRFTGQTSFYQNTDIRLKLADVKGYVFRGALGVYGFFDDGRVWIKNEKSTLLHTGYGGGIYYIPYSTLAINLSYAMSKEVNVFTFRTGFLF